MSPYRSVSSYHDVICTSRNIFAEFFQNSIEALLNNDMLKANENIKAVEKLDALNQRIKDYTFKQESVLAIPLDNTIESIRKLGEHSRDISENVMNNISMEKS